MAVLGLAIFTIGVALFSAFHSVPIPYLNQNVDFPLRLAGSLGFGYVFSSLETMAENFLAIESDTSQSRPLGLTESPTPYLDALSTTLDEIPHSTTGTDDGFETEEAIQHPVTEIPNVPAATTVIIIQTMQAMPAYDGPVELMNVPQPMRTERPRERPFGRLNSDVNDMVILTYASLVVVFIAYLLFLYMTTGAAYERTKGAANRAVETELAKFTADLQAQQLRLDLGVEWVDQLEALVQSSKDELERQVQSARAEVEREKAQLLATVKETREGIIRWQTSIKKTCAQAELEEKNLIDSIEHTVLELLKTKRVDYWRETVVGPLKEDVAEAKVEVETEVESVREKASRALDKLDEIFEKEKGEFMSGVRKSEKNRPPFPDLAPLRAQVSMLEDNVKTSALQVQELDARMSGHLSDLPALKAQSEAIDVTITRLEEDILLQRLAMKRLTEDQRDMEKKMGDRGKKPDVSKPVASTDPPREPLPPLPADLMADLLGESSSNEEEEADGEGEGEKEASEGPEETAGSSEGASTPEPYKPRRRLRPNKRMRAKARAQAQAASSSSGPGDGGEVDGAVPAENENDS